MTEATYKGCELCICNVRSLYTTNYLMQLITETIQYELYVSGQFD